MKAIVIIASIGAFGFFCFVMGQSSVSPAEAPKETPMYIVQVPTNWPGKWLVFGGSVGIWDTQAEAQQGAAWMATNQIKKP